MFGPYCQDLGLIFSQYGPRAWLIIYIFFFSRNKANNFFLVNFLETAYVTGQNDRQTQILSGQIVILAGHCPMTGRYFEP